MRLLLALIRPKKKLGGGITTTTGTITGGIAADCSITKRGVMPLLTSFDGKVYELDEETLEKYRIADEDVRKLGLIPPLPAPPAEPPPVSGAAKQGVARRSAAPGASG